MISATGHYRTTGITVECYHGKWAASLSFYDDGFADDDPDDGHIATQGTLATRYLIPDGVRPGLSAAIDMLMRDTANLGIEFRWIDGEPPEIYYRGDGEDPRAVPPEGWRELLAAEARRIGWQSTAAEPESAP